MTLLQVKNLDVFLKTDEELVHAVKDLSFTVEKGETLAIVGESGSGKSVTSMAIMQLLTKNHRCFLMVKSCLTYLKDRCVLFVVIRLP